MPSMLGRHPAKQVKTSVVAIATVDFLAWIALFVVLVVLVMLVMALPVRAAEPRAGRVAVPADKPLAENDHGFLRITRDPARKPMALETAIASYVETPEAAAAAGRAELDVHAPQAG